MARDGMMTLANRKGWAMREFGETELGDARRTKRLVKLAAQMAAHSDGSIPQQTGTTADMKAAYRLFAEEDVTHDAICGPHIEKTRRAAEQLPLVFLVQDTTELNFTQHVHCRGLGPIGHGGQLRGLHQQNVLAVDPTTGQPLGLMYQHHHRRQSRNDKNSRKEQRRRALSKRESFWWVQAIQSIGSPPAGVRWVHVGDRGEDIFGVYDEARRVGADWLIRAARDRRVDTPTGPDHLMNYARHLPAVATRQLKVRNKAAGTLREVTLNVSAGMVTLLPSKTEPEYRNREPISCWVVRVWEPNPAKGTPPLEWVLLTSLSCEEPQVAVFVAEGYSFRWIIEEYHKCEKTGCQVESRRLQDTDRLEPLTGLLSVLAVWLLQLKFATRENPQQPASKLFGADMVEVMARYLKRPARGLTAGEFWRGIGRLGGHPGRRQDGPLGWLRAWRGWQSFQLIFLGATQFASAAGARCG